MTASSTTGRLLASSMVTNSILVRTNINTQFNHSTYIYYFIILFLLLMISSLMHLFSVDSFQISDMHLHRSSKSIIFFQKMMYYSCLVLVVLLSHHSFVLLDISFSSFSSSSLFEIYQYPSFVDSWPGFLFVAYKNSLLTRYNRYFHSHIEDPVHFTLYTVNYNTWQAGAGAAEGSAGCITTHNIPGSTQH